MLRESIQKRCWLPRLTIPSSHNIITRVKGSDDHVIVNLLSGEADILGRAEVEAFEKGIFPDPGKFAKKGYLVDPREEEQVYRSKYLDFLDDKEKDEVQVFFVPWYACNFACSYCYQDEYAPQPARLEKEVIDAFFDSLDRLLSGRRYYITLFGGEPLLPGSYQKQIVEYMLIKASEAGKEVAIVTNGYHLMEYQEVLLNSKIREIQLTLDGPQAIHDKRRFLKNTEGTFKRISASVDWLLEHQIPVNLRMVIDKENVNSLPELARYAIDRGWTASPHFKTQLGRNYELHHCQTTRQKLYTRLDMHEDIHDLLKKHPEILEFHRPAFSVSRFLFDNGELPSPLFDSCPATKTEWAFDYTGKIYPCTANVGKEGEELGNFYPEFEMHRERVEIWEERDVTSISECRGCSQSLACGGGCGAVAKNQHGSVLKPDCRPIKELIGLGIGCYFSQEKS